MDWLCMNFFFVTLGAICDVIPGAPYWTNNDGFHQIFGLAPRIAFASFLAFICGSFVNAYIMSKMKLSSGGKNFSLRAVVSTIFGESVDQSSFSPWHCGVLFPPKNCLVDALAGDFENRLRDCCIAFDHSFGALCKATREG